MSPGFLPLSTLVLLLSALPALQAQRCGQPPPAGSSSALEGQRSFATRCAACHGLDARGGERGPDLANKREVQQLSDEALLRIIQDGIAGTGMPAFRSLGAAQIQPIVRHLRGLQGQAAAVELPGDPERGKVLFFAGPALGASGCSQCHMANGEGGFVGPDPPSSTLAPSAAHFRSPNDPSPPTLKPRPQPVR